MNALAWGGPPIGALVFRDPAVIDSFSSMSLNPYATGAERLEIGAHQYGLLAGLVASVEYLASLDESANGTRRERLSVSMQSAAAYMSRLFDYLLVSLQSLPPIMVIGRPEVSIPVLSFVVEDVPAERVVQRLADNGVLAIANASSRVLDVIGVNDIGGAVTVGLAHYTTTAEVDQLVRRLLGVARLTYRCSPTARSATRRSTLPGHLAGVQQLVCRRRLLDRELRPDDRAHPAVGDHRPHVAAPPRRRSRSCCSALRAGRARSAVPMHPGALGRSACPCSARP